MLIFLSSVARRFCVDGALKVFAFFATDRTQARQNVELLLGLRDVSGFDIELAKVFACGFALWLELQRLRVVGQRGLEVAGLAKRETNKL